ncbi:hypothetical protein UCDDS831_g05216 [Diplodia seriata]|uniref:Uncharacterized protein n=1 Tax=Diplodia seriata TaxID=420778 RepID=A0A0G2E979_9PEZI|nr:hypothetical protein UCDDS831_g05216 [Diplodia seriata]
MQRRDSATLSSPHRRGGSGGGSGGAAVEKNNNNKNNTDKPRDSHPHHHHNPHHQQHQQHQLRRGSAEDVRRFQDGDEATMAVEDGGCANHNNHETGVVSVVVRRGRLDAHGRWEYQLWHAEDGTAYDGGHWFRETELS